MYGGDKEVIKQKTKITRKQGSSSSPQGQRTIKQKRKVKIVRNKEGSSSSSSSQKERQKRTNLGTTGYPVGTTVQPVGTTGQPVGVTGFTATEYTAYDATGLNQGITGPGTGLTGGHMHPTSTQTTEKKGFVEKVKSKLPGYHK